MDPRIAGDDHPSGRAELDRATLPVRHHGTGTRQDRQDRQIVVGLQPLLDHQVDKARGEQAIAIAVGIELGEVDRLLDCINASRIGPFSNIRRE